MDDDMSDNKSYIMMITMILHKIDDKDFTDEYIFIYDPSDRITNRFRGGTASFLTEQHMISDFLSTIELFRPIAIIGWDISKFDYPFLKARASKFDIDTSYIESIKWIDLMNCSQKVFIYGSVNSVAASLRIYDDTEITIFKTIIDPIDRSVSYCKLFKKVFDKLNIIKELNLKVCEKIEEPTDDTELVVEI
jgi:DNA polymerase elongation subunit (family B)